jgi:hypothetical protein
MKTNETIKSVEPYYFEDTASLLTGALALLEQANPDGRNNTLLAVAGILDVAKSRLLDDKLTPIVEMLESLQGLHFDENEITAK